MSVVTYTPRIQRTHDRFDTLVIDSRHRSSQYTTPSEYVVDFKDRYSNITSIAVEAATLPKNQLLINQNNRVLVFGEKPVAGVEGDISTYLHYATYLKEGNYTAEQLATEIETRMLIATGMAVASTAFTLINDGSLPTDLTNAGFVAESGFNFWSIQLPATVANYSLTTADELVFFSEDSQINNTSNPILATSTTPHLYYIRLQDSITSIGGNTLVTVNRWTVNDANATGGPTSFIITNNKNPFYLNFINYVDNPTATKYTVETNLASLNIDVPGEYDNFVNGKLDLTRILGFEEQIYQSALLQFPQINTHAIGAPLNYNMHGELSVTLKIDEIDGQDSVGYNNSNGNQISNDSAQNGLGQFIWDVNSDVLRHTSNEYWIGKVFRNPISSLSKLTIRWLNSDNIPYDFRGSDHTLILRIHYGVQAN